MVTTMDLLEQLRSHRVVGIIRGSSAEAAIAAGRVLAECGLPLIEVSLTTPDALGAISELSAVEGAMVGAGTVLTEADAAAVAEAGGQFIVTPAITPGIAAGVALGLPVLGGAQTASEALQALELGASAVKLFPASVGGPGYLKALRDPLPNVPFVPVGGVDLEVARAYLRVGAVAVGVGGPLVGDAASEGSLDELRERAIGFAGLAREFA